MYMKRIIFIPLLALLASCQPTKITQSWSAKDNIEFTLGNAGVVEVELDGRVIPPLGRKGQAIKNIRVTKNEGLIVPR